MKYSSVQTVAAAAIGASVLMAGYSGIVAARAYSASVLPARTLSAQAEGSAFAIPDMASFVFGVVTEGGLDVAALQQENAEKANAVIAFLEEQGIADEDVQTISYRIDPRERSCDPWRGVCPPSEIVGYAVRQQVRVKARDLAAAGDLLAGVAERGANTVSSLSFDVEDRTDVQAEARAEAVEKAKEKAREIAGQGGLKLGRLLSIREAAYAPGAFREYTAADEAGIGGSAPDIRPGSQKVSVSVVLEYEVR